MPKKKQSGQLGKQQERELPPGVKLHKTLRGHTGPIGRIAWSPDGRIIATPSDDKTIRLWNAETGMVIRTLEEHSYAVTCVAWSPDGRSLASGSRDRLIKIWDPPTGRSVRTLQGASGAITTLAWSPDGVTLASSSADPFVSLWDSPFEKMPRALIGHSSDASFVAWIPKSNRLVTGSEGGTVRIWDAENAKELIELGLYPVSSIAMGSAGRRLWVACSGIQKAIKIWDISEKEPAAGLILEGHTDLVTSVAFSANGRLFGSKSLDNTVRLWSSETWKQAAIVPEIASRYLYSSLAFHPRLPFLATVGSYLDAPEQERDTLVHIWELDLDALLGETPREDAARHSVQHTTAKIVLVGDSGVGKTGLAWRLAHGEFMEHASTHGQQFWVLKQVSTRRDDGTECEAILWDLAGQPDYRLTHALFLDDADLGLILFDPTDSRDPLHGVEFWLKQLKARGTKSTDSQDSPTILVGARADRGEARLTQEELDAFCRQRGIRGGYLATSAKEDIGLDELLKRIKNQVAWGQKTTTVTTVTFKRIKDYVLGLKENHRRKKVIVSPQDLRKRLEKTDREWTFTDAEMMTAVGHLANYGYVRVLRTSNGDERILLAPELLNNLASSFVLEARRNPKGLGSLEEKPLLAGEYPFRELEKLSGEEQDVLLDSAASLFLEHNICFRETTLDGQSYLVFPELINLKKPILEDETKTDDAVAYTVSGAVENVYASLVVLLGYTQTFTRTNQWQDQARYVMGDGSVCGFRQESEHDGELEFVLYFGTDVLKSGRKIFEGMFERFLARRNLNVFRYEPVICSNGHPLNRAVVRDELRSHHSSAFCSRCGEKLSLPKADEPIQLTQTERQKVEEQQWVAARRSSFEQAVFQLVSYVEGQKLARAACFISYAWGDAAQERWVERSLATDLLKAGLIVILDRWENERVGASVSRFVERIEKCDRIIVVGTPTYRRKYENKDTSTGYVVAAEVDLISNRLLGTEVQKESVMPALLAGEKNSSLPPLLHSRVFGDFRDERKYFITAFDLILDLYGITHNDPAVADLRRSLREREMR